MHSSSLRSYFKKFNVKLYFGNNPTSTNIEQFIRYDTLDENDHEEIEKYFEIFKGEFNKYNGEFIKNIDLRIISLAKNLKVHNPLSNTFKSVYNTTDPDTKALICDIYNTNWDREYQKRCIHHELFHLLEFNLHGTYLYEDRKWLSFNPKNFRYGKSGFYAYDNETFENLKYPIKGFVSSYATLGIEEDRAEIFMYLMSDELNFLLFNWIKDDEVLRKKVLYMKEFLKKLDLNLA